jgi:tetratricopeptide (TPR) repeat protein
MSPFVLAAFLAIQSPQAAQDEIKDALLRAESLYFEAKFADSVQVLTRVNDALKTQPERLPERISTKLQLALANVGLNNTAAAKLFWLELYALNPDFNLDTQQFSPKIIALANEAKTEQNKLRCQAAGEEARRNLAGGDSSAVVTLLQSMKARCAELSSLEADVAELVYKKGLSEYKQGDLANAAQNFRLAVKLAPKHEMAAQYLELAENKLQVAQDRVLLDWQKNFDSRQFKQAGAIYRQIASFGNNAAKPLDHMTAEYRQALIPLVEDVNRACSTNDSPKMDEVRNRISEMLPEPSFGEDIRSRIVPCTPPPPPPETPKVAAIVEPEIVAPAIKQVPLPEPVVVKQRVGCFRMESALALVRLKSRVEPEIPAAVRTFIPSSGITITIKARIDERGNVTVHDATGANPVITSAMRTAVEKWKFTPVADGDGPRCVDTEFPINLGTK